MSMERDQIISHLLQACDAKERTIAGLQKDLADARKSLAQFQPPEETQLTNGVDKTVKQ